MRLTASTVQGGYGDAADGAAGGHGWARATPEAQRPHPGREQLGRGHERLLRATDRYTETKSDYAEPWSSRSVAETGYGRADSGYGQADSGYRGAVDGYPGAANGADRTRTVTRAAPLTWGRAATPRPHTPTRPTQRPGTPSRVQPQSRVLRCRVFRFRVFRARSIRSWIFHVRILRSWILRSWIFRFRIFRSGARRTRRGRRPGYWQADQALRRAGRRRGLMVSAATEFLATAVVIGVSTLAAGLLKSTVSPVSAMGTVFIDRTPAMLRGFALHHFGSQGRTVLLLGMYAVIAVIAIAIGAAARRAAALGVTGVAAFTLFVAFVAVTRPASRVSDVMPAVIGGLAGVAALLWLVRASAPIQEVTPLRPARGGTRRRTR